MTKIKARILHTMLRVKNLEASIEFYTENLGMNLLRRQDFETGRFTLAFLGYGSEEESSVLELTHNWDTKDYDIGNGFGHIALGVQNIYKTCASIENNGYKIHRKPGPMKHGKTIIAFIEDPDSYKIELIDLSSREKNS